MAKKRRKKNISIEEEYGPYKNMSNDSDELISQYINDNKFTKKKMLKLIEQSIELKNDKKKIKKIKFIIEMVPKPSPRPRINMFTKSVYVEGAKKNREFFNKMVECGKIQVNERIYTSTFMKIKFYLPIPSAMNQNEKVLSEAGLIRPTSKADWDNLGKTTDMFNDTLWVDDALVVDCLVQKYYSFKPRIEVTIKYEELFDSKYNMNRIMKTKEYKKLFKKDIING